MTAMVTCDFSPMYVCAVALLFNVGMSLSKEATWEVVGSLRVLSLEKIKATTVVSWISSHDSKLS